MNQRGAPRARPKKGKMVVVKPTAQGDEYTYPLFDLSMGGLAFLSTEPNLFVVGEQMEIMGFDEKSFDDPMIAVIRVVKELVEMKGQHKVGVQFIE
jgi:c-di-GMP-binding flagellar brake protein YcgR